MNLKRDQYARFDDGNSHKPFSSARQFFSNHRLFQIRKFNVSSLLSGIGRGFEKFSEKIKSLKRYVHDHTQKVHPRRKPGSKKTILDPQGQFLQNWNKIFVLTCIIALSLDPLFFYIPVINGTVKFLDLDKKLEIIACVLRSFTDLFYVFHIFLQFRTGFIAPSSRVFGRGELINDQSAIVKRYLRSHFLVDILSVLPLPQVIGAFWYLFSIEQQNRCWRRICGEHPDCDEEYLYSGDRNGNYAFLNSSCPPLGPDDIKNATAEFNFGIFVDALKSSVVENRSFWPKLLYCFWWGLRNLSSLGQNLKTSDFVWEILFAISIAVIGLVLFSLLIGNMQKYLQSITVRVEEMRVKRRDAEQWMSHRMLPDNLKERIRRYEQYKWQETRGVEEETLICNLPKDLRRDLKRHLCWSLLRKVPMFKKMDEQLLDALCDRLKPVLYTETSFIFREGDPVDEMLFVMRGNLLTMTTNGGRTGFFNSVNLKAGDFCGEELLTWALDPHSPSSLPASTRTVKAVTDVEAFALMADDLKSVAAQFRRLHSKQLQHTFRLYSQQWRTWAACFIQAAWRRHCRRKLEKSLQEEEDRLKDALAKDGGNSVSLGATIQASRFAANMLRALRRNRPHSMKLSTRLPPLGPLLLQKPTEPDFTAENPSEC